MELEIQQVLVVSTGHLTRAESQRFEDGEPPGSIGTLATYEYGWIIYVGQSGDIDDPENEISDGLRGVIETAWKHGIEWIKLDSDGPYLDGIPTYEW